MQPGTNAASDRERPVPRMRRSRRIAMTIVGATCCSAALALATTSPAIAFTNWPSGTVTAVDDGRGFKIGELTTCSASFGGHLSWDAGMWMGGVINIDEFTFTNCTGGASVTANAVARRAWGIDGTLSAVLYGIDLDVTTPSGTCRYTGTMYGHHLVDRAQHSGPLFRQGGDCGGDSSEPASVGFFIRDRDGDPPIV